MFSDVCLAMTGKYPSPPSGSGFTSALGSALDVIAPAVLISALIGAS